MLAATFAAGNAALAGTVNRDAASRRPAVGRQAAIRAALSALGVARRSDAEIVFGLARPIAAHTAVTLGGPARPASGGLAMGTRAAVALRPAHAAWLFYDDRGPFQAYEHPGRLAFVDTVTGHVTMSRTLLWPPVVGGALPPFLRGADAYAAASSHVFYRPYRGAATLAAAGYAADGVRAAFDATQARRAAAVLAAEHVCVVSLGDTLGGGYYDLARVVQSRGSLDGRISQLRSAAPGVRSVSYAARGRATPASLVRSEVSAHGCREVMLYAAGSGYLRGTAVNIGMRLTRGAVRHQDVTVAALRGLIRAESRVTFLLVVDAPSAAGFQQLVGLPNVRLVATPAGGPSFTYVPEAVVGGTLRANATNPAKLLQLTDRLAAGLDLVIDDPCEVTRATALQRAGKSGFAYLLARSLARGGSADWVARVGVGPAPAVRTTGFSAAAPTCLPADAVTATDDAFTAHNDAFFGASSAQGLLVNDSDTQRHAVSVDQLDGIGGPLPLHGTSAKGAVVVIHADGGFSYDARNVAAIQAMPRGQTTTDTFSYRMTDGLGATDTATVTMTVLGTRNHNPVTQGESATVSRTVPLQGPDVLANDSDPDGDALSVSQLNGVGGTLPLHGTSDKGAAVTLNADGTYTYDPTISPMLQALRHGASTPDTFTYGVSDGHGGTGTATVTLTVTGENHSPLARDDSAGPTAANAVLSRATSVLVNDSDPDRDPITITQLNGAGGTLPLHGTSDKGAAVTLNADGTYTYDPTNSATLKALPEGVRTTDSFAYTIDDGLGGTSPATVSITVNGLNDPPVAVNDGTAGQPFGSTTSNILLTSSASVLTNDSDPDTGDSISLKTTTTTSADGAAVTINSDGTWSYDPTTSSTLQALPRGQPATDTFTYTIEDSHHAVSNTATVTIKVTGGINHAPVAVADSASVTADTVLQSPASVLANDTDLDNDVLSVTQLNGSTSLTGTSTDGGVVTINAFGAYTYDPTGSATLKALPAGVPTTDTLSYTVDDGHGGHDTGTLSITVAGVNDPPIAVNDGSAGTPIATTTSDTALTGQSTLFANDSDPDTGDTLSLKTASTLSAKGATVNVNSNGTWSYDPTTSTTLQALPRDQSTTDTFTYSVKDNHGSDSNTATVTVAVTGVNHAPVAVADTNTTLANAVLTVPAPGVIGNDADADGDSPTVTKLNGSTTLTAVTGDGAVVTIHADGSYTYDPTGSATLETLGVGAPTTDSFTYTIDDGHGGTSTATVSITVTGVNDPPTATDDGSAGTPVASTSADTPLTGQSTLFANDSDPDLGDTLSLKTASTTSADGATVAVNNNGTWSYDPTTSSTLQALAKGEPTTDTFTYSVKDNHGVSSNTATVTVGVAGVNHPPVANDDTYSVAAGQTLNDGSSVLTNDSDADSDPLTASLVSGPTHGTLMFNSDGTFSYTNDGTAGPDTFTYRVNDGTADSSIATVTINVSS